MKKGFFAAASVSIAVLITSLAPVAALAADTSGPNPATVGQALEISPPVVTMTVDPGQIVRLQISLRDVSSGNLIVGGQANDFVAAGEDGTPKILLDNQDAGNPYSLKNWVQPITSMLMVPKQIKTLQVTLNVPQNASPGGHYGVIRFTATPPELQGTGVSLSASLGSLLLITVRGNIQDKLAVQDFSVNQNGKAGHIFQSPPINFAEAIKNTGNEHEEPTGVIVIKDMFGRVVAGVNVNTPPRNILPSSTRKFSQTLDKGVLGSKRLFGHYTATMNLTYGAKKQTLTATTSFWIIPYKLILIIIILLVGGFFLLRFLIRRHDQRVMRKIRSQQHYPNHRR